MKEVNLISIVQAYKELNQPLRDTYFSTFKINPKPNEIEDLQSLIEQLNEVSSDNSILDNYFLGYSIPQISKEFDLLRIDDDSVVNIELKSESTEAKIFKQLERNSYYLSFLKRDVHIFTYVSSEKQLYTLNYHKTLVKVGFKKLFRTLSDQKKVDIPDINTLFNPSNYLVSPFNSTDEFIDGKYFLTGHQEEIKKECLKEISRKGTSFLSICGKAGTGKTLLTFDIAKEIISSLKSTLVIHCGKLNQGHCKLIMEYEWDIVSIRDYETRALSNYHLIVIDETQRIYPSQLLDIVAKVKKNKKNCIFSYDNQQCLRNWETRNNISQLISDETSSKVFTLKDKIRTNKEIASFINAIFDKSRTIERLKRENVEITYFKDYKNARRHIEILGEQGWKIINYTPSSKHRHPYVNFAVVEEDNTHEVIGQEFDNVIAVIDKYFYYKENKLDIKGYEETPYYQPEKMLFQIMTRTRKKLSIVIIDNDEILNRCLTILNSSSS